MKDSNLPQVQKPQRETCASCKHLDCEADTLYDYVPSGYFACDKICEEVWEETEFAPIAFLGNDNLSFVSLLVKPDFSCALWTPREAK